MNRHGIQREQKRERNNQKINFILTHRESFIPNYCCAVLRRAENLIFFSFIIIDDSPDLRTNQIFLNNVDISYYSLDLCLLPSLYFILFLYTEKNIFIKGMKQKSHANKYLTN